MDQRQPTAIICHASEDKQSFVLPFSYKLAEYGIKVLVDEWELQSNDSLIERIFTEGVKNADAFLIILSNFSVNKPWVTEELRAGLVKRIGIHSKLVPVLIEDAVVPDVLAASEWVKIRDLDNYDREMLQIARAIRNEPVQPIVKEGVKEAPRSTQGAISTPGVGAVAPAPSPSVIPGSIPGLTQNEILVLKVSNDYAVEKSRTFINTSDVRRVLETNGLTLQQIDKALEILDEKGLIKAARILGSASIEIYNVTPFGFEAYARAFIPGYDDLAFKMLSALANEGLETNDDLVTRFNVPMSVANFTLDVFETKNLIKKGKSLGGAVLVKNVTEAGKKFLQG